MTTWCLHRAQFTCGINASSSDVSVKIYEGMRHELVNETCRDEVIQTLAHWMLERVMAALVCAQ